METIENEMMNIFSKMTHVFGIGESATKILALLYLEPKEVAMEEIAEKTGYSLASVSNKMKIFETAGFVERVKKPGTRKVFFYMEKNLAKLNIRKLEKMKSYYLKPTLNYLPGMIKKYKEKAKTNIAKEKLEIMETYYNQLKDMEKLFDKWGKDLENLK